MFLKAGGNFRETFGIIRQIASYSLYETSTGRLLFEEKKTKKQEDKFLFDTLESRKKMNSKPSLVFLKIAVPNV